jgi:hypothetical protein
MGKPSGRHIRPRVYIKALTPEALISTSRQEKCRLPVPALRAIEVLERFREAWRSVKSRTQGPVSNHLRIVVKLHTMRTSNVQFSKAWNIYVRRNAPKHAADHELRP